MLSERCPRYHAHPALVQVLLSWPAVIVAMDTDDETCFHFTNLRVKATVRGLAPLLRRSHFWHGCRRESVSTKEVIMGVPPGHFWASDPWTGPKTATERVVKRSVKHSYVASC